MLAKNLNDDACFLNKRGAQVFFASKLAPTGVRAGPCPFGASHIFDLCSVQDLAQGNEIDPVANGQ
ncbi:hypothetical protein, partial [Pseudomonas paralactis]|uniref:hypothetical protein n=1 Tax=Pseudomonas paralactis TaxID=1615673 RepID=UPI001E2A0419